MNVHAVFVAVASISVHAINYIGISRMYKHLKIDWHSPTFQMCRCGILISVELHIERPFGYIWNRLKT